MDAVSLPPSLSPPSSPPPRRPSKSRLRTLSAMDQMSLHSSNLSVNSLSTTSEASYQPGDDSSSINSRSGIPTPPLKSKYRSRFTEHFDQKRPDNLKPSKSLNTITPAPLKSPVLMKRSITSAEDVIMKASPVPMAPRLTTSISTPLQMPRKYDSSGSILTVISLSNTSATTPAGTTSHHHSSPPSSASLNRAAFIIARMQSWHQFLKSITSWIQETAKISSQNSRAFSHKAYPHLNSYSSEDQQQVNEVIGTVRSGCRALTMQVVAEQKAFSKSLDREHLPPLFKLRKQLKERIHQLKHDPNLLLDELLRRAEVTRSKMTHLSRCCKQADKTRGQVEMDPWVANLLVLKQLKHEVDEENRLRLLMIPLQKEAMELEQHIIEQIKPTIKYCFESLMPGASDQQDTESYEALVSKIMPQEQWSQFVEANKADFVNESYPTKDYLRINYPNKSHPLVMTLLKGKMEKKVGGVRKQFVEKNYVLTQGGYLHQFSMSDKVRPEKTIYIPNTTIVPSIDLHQLHNVMTEYAGDTSNIFEICRAATSVLQRDKVSVFRTASREELVTWCRMLVQIASGINLPSLGVSSDDDLILKSSSLSFDSIERPNSPLPPLRRTSTPTIVKDTVSSTSPKSLIMASGASSPTRSVHSVRTEESFNEPAAYSSALTPTASSFPKSTIVEVILEEENYSTDSESFVTARLNETISEEEINNDDDSIDDIDALGDYFGTQHISLGVKEEEEDTISIASNSTAKGPSPNQQDSPLLRSNTNDDAQSSVYFSSTSDPPSPTAQSDRSSVVSIPDFEISPPRLGNNGRMSAAETYKATLSMSLEDDF